VQVKEERCEEQRPFQVDGNELFNQTKATVVDKTNLKGSKGHQVR